MRSLWRRVFHKYWWSFGWHNKYRPGVPHVTWSLCLSNVNRPSLRWDRSGYICLDWGNQNGDPVWSIGFEW